MSRYNSGGKVYKDADGNVKYWERSVIPKDMDDIQYTIAAKYDCSPDLLALDMYGSTSYEWVILQFNNIIDVHEEFRTGKQIKLPSIKKAKLYR